MLPKLAENETVLEGTVVQIWEEHVLQHILQSMTFQIPVTQIHPFTNSVAIGNRSKNQEQHRLNFWGVLLVL